MRFGHKVYILRTLGTNYYKIGRTKNFPARLSELQTGTPFTLEVVGIYEVGDAFYVETYLHHKLKSYRTRGEWFEFTEDNIITLKDLLSAQGAVLSKEDAVVWDEVSKHLAPKIRKFEKKKPKPVGKKLDRTKLEGLKLSKTNSQLQELD